MPDAPAPPPDQTIKDPRKKIAAQFIAMIPHAGALSMSLTDVGDGEAVITMPYDARLVGDPETGVIHGGAVSALMDTCCGAAVMLHPAAGMGTATIDLRIDYMRPARPQADLIADGHCYKLTRTIAFVRALAHDGDPDDPVATAQAAFALIGGGA